MAMHTMGTTTMYRVKSANYLGIMKANCMK